MLSPFLRLFAIYSQKQPLTCNTLFFSPQSNQSSTGGVFQLISSNLSRIRDGHSSYQASSSDKELPTSVPTDFRRVLNQVQSFNCIHITICKHNVITTLSTPEGRPLAWATCGLLGFKNARKRTELASTAVGRCIGDKALAKRIDRVQIKIRGLAMKRRVATVKGIVNSGVKIMAITDTTPLPFGHGRKPPAVRSL